MADAETDVSAVPREIDRLLAIMARLRDPESGCPWDVQQTFATIAPYKIEEAYEVADAIERGSVDDLKDELGDLLLQVVFHAQIAHEDGMFDFDDVACAISDKMVRRHPHVFGDANVSEAKAVRATWDDIKAAERAAKRPTGPLSVLDDVPRALPALMRAQKIQKRAGRVGFDWPNAAAVFDKIAEETAEVHSAMASGDADHIHEEVGDLLFAVVNLSRKLDVDAETALNDATLKFKRRFSSIEAEIKADGLELATVGLQRLEAAWQRVKQAERTR